MITRFLWLACCTLSVLVIPTQLFAQEVRVVKKPLPSGYRYDEWTVSHSQKDVPSTMMLDGVFSSEAKAMKVVRRLQSARKTGDGFDIAVILVEVQGSASSDPLAGLVEGITSAGEELERMAAVVKNGVRLTGDTLREYADVLANAYDVVTAAKKKITAQIDKASNDVVKAVNKQIDEYNGQAKAYNTLVRSPEVQRLLQAQDNLAVPPKQKRKAGNQVRRAYSLHDAKLIEPLRTSEFDHLQVLPESSPEQNPVPATADDSEENSTRPAASSEEGIVGKWYVRVPEYKIGGSLYGGSDYVYVFHADGTYEKAYLSGNQEEWDDANARFPQFRGTWKISTSDNSLVEMLPDGEGFHHLDLSWHSGVLKYADRRNYDGEQTWFVMQRQQ